MSYSNSQFLQLFQMWQKEGQMIMVMMHLKKTSLIKFQGHPRGNVREIHQNHVNPKQRRQALPVLSKVILLIDLLVGFDIKPAIELPEKVREMLISCNPSYMCCFHRICHVYSVA